MNNLTQAIQDYLKMRQSVGFKLVQVEALLKDFATFMTAQDASWVTTELALQWAVQAVNGQPEYWSKRLIAVRGFARVARACLGSLRTADPAGHARGSLHYHPLNPRRH